MNRYLNKEILRLSIPSILANLTVPLVGMVDTAVAGHLRVADGLGAAEFIGGISVGALLFNLLYWNFFFVRASTAGLTAQAFGRGDMQDCTRILGRGLIVGVGIALLLVLLQWPIGQLGMLLVKGTPEVARLALTYFFIRIWAGPANLALMALRGWFVGMQDSVSSMLTDLVVNGVNIAASIILSLGVGSWEGLGFPGVAWGTVVAQYSGLAFASLVCVLKYGKVLSGGVKLRECLSGSGLREFTSMNFDLLLRSFGFTAIYMGYTTIAARFGNELLACSSIMMNILLIFSYFTDGFAYAGEALTGRFIGAGDRPMTRLTVRYVFGWSIALGLLFMVFYRVGGMPLVRLLTDDAEVVEACRAYIPWLVLMPVFGCAAFAWDGIYIGATAAKGIRNAMLGAAAAFFAVWLLGSRFISAPEAGMHVLLAAYFAHLLLRTVYLTVRYPKDILSK